MATVLATFGGAAAAHATSLKHGVYDCEEYDYSYGTLDYTGSIKLMSRGRYQAAAGRHHSKLKKPSHGKYSVKGKLVHFKGGGYRKAVGHITKTPGGSQPHIALYYKGKSSGISCYYVAHP